MCSSDLHPEVVLTAAHCLLNGDPPNVRLGESAASPARTVAIDYCERSPEYEWPEVGGHDFGACRLVEPIDDVPIVPPLMGCETDLLVMGTQVIIAGFGQSEVNGDPGIKHVAQTTITGELQLDGSIEVGDVGVAGCQGDSGGPVFVQVADGSWRVFGILSGGPACTFGADTYGTMHTNMAFFEDMMGIDITPCHDADGTWNPTPHCDEFPLDPATIGEWSESCPSPLSESSASCGDPFDAIPDEDAPTVSIVNPPDETHEPDAPASFDVEIEADDGEGWGVETVTLSANGQLVGTLDAPPYVVAGAVFPEGEWELVAEATDWAGNVAATEPVVVYVGELPEGTTGSTDGDEGSESGDGSSSDGTESTSGEDEAGVDDVAGGCACGIDRRRQLGQLGPLLLLLAGIPAWRRRTPHCAAPRR